MAKETQKHEAGYVRFITPEVRTPPVLNVPTEHCPSLIKITPPFSRPHPFISFVTLSKEGLLNISNSWPFHQHLNARDPPEENVGVFKKHALRLAQEAHPVVP
jgi:hypothetical protein